LLRPLRSKRIVVFTDIAYLWGFLKFVISLFKKKTNIWITNFNYRMFKKKYKSKILEKMSELLDAKE